MARRGRKKSPFKMKLRIETIYSLGSLFFFAAAGLIMISFSGQGESLQEVNNVLRDQFGWSSLLLPFVLLCGGLVLTGAKWSFAKPQVLIGSFLFFLSAMTIGRTGVMGQTLFSNFSDLVQPTGTLVIFSLVGVAGFMIFTDTSLREIFAFLTSFVEVDSSEKTEPKKSKADETADEEKDTKGWGLPGFRLGKKKDDETPADAEPASDTSFVVNQTATRPTLDVESTTPTTEPLSNKPGTHVWEYPPLNLLSSKKGKAADRGDIKQNAQIIEDTLNSFGIQARVMEVNCGPAVTQYALTIGTGTKLTKITSLANDLALALAAPTGMIRIEAPIPGRSLVGIEIPNRTPEFVSLKTMLTSPEMQKDKSKLAVALGLNVAGTPVMADISKMPHVLIAGSTGSGKSVSVNAFIASILFRASPEEVKFIMVDPKRVELSVYNDIPHLLTPVITDPKKVVAALRWACAEMDKRYKLFAEVGVRNIASYNEMSGFQAMPYIVVVIDELADLMLFAPTEVEESIVRLAQMARAVGIHLVLATQRPSVDVITGLIKANIPTRLAFNVSSGTDSRVIIDSTGAEKLIGRGDMLYVPPDESKPRRVQGTYVSDSEIAGLIQYLKAQSAEPQYQTEVVEKFQKATSDGSGTGTEEQDELFDEALQVVLESGKGSASYIQRRLSVGYNRAARILDQLAEAGIVGPAQGAKPREINHTVAKEYLAKKSGESAA